MVSSSRLSPSPRPPLLPIAASPRLPISPTPVLRFLPSTRPRRCLCFSTLCYNPASTATGVSKIRYPEAGLAATKANAQANKRRDIAEQHYRIPLASDSYRSHQSYCNCNLTSSRSLPGTSFAWLISWWDSERLHSKEGRILVTYSETPWD